MRKVRIAHTSIVDVESMMKKPLLPMLSDHNEDEEAYTESDGTIS